MLGYDCFTGETPKHEIAEVEPAVLSLATVQPRRYGFHATLVAPFGLNGASESDLIAAAQHFARRHRPVMIGPLALATLGSFIALRPAQPHRDVEELAAACLEPFDRFRALPSAQDRERRLAAGLTPRQIELMDRWGYPYVLDQFRFHMTLAGPLAGDERRHFKARLDQAYGRLAADQIELDAISLMRQDDRAARFCVVARYRLSGT